MDAVEALPWKQLPVVLGFITGMMDVVGCLLLSGFFTANITGDLTESVTYLVSGTTFHVLRVGVIPVFFGGVVLVYFLARRLGPRSASMIRSLASMQFLLLVVVCLVGSVSGPVVINRGAQVFVAGLAAVLAIALSNTTMHLLDKNAPTTWALTANCVTASIAALNIVTRSGSAQERARDFETLQSIWPTVCAFLIGGLIGAIAVETLHNHAWLVPTAASSLFLAALWLPAGLLRRLTGRAQQHRENDILD
jgi:uncharacterized membrane protein YoaK (UPF0700 family)